MPRRALKTIAIKIAQERERGTRILSQRRLWKTHDSDESGVGNGLMSLVSEMYPGLRREHDSEVGWRESYAKTNGFESLMYEMWPGLRRQHDSEVIGSESYAKTNVILMSMVSEMYPGLRREHDSEVGW